MGAQAESKRPPSRKRCEEPWAPASQTSSRLDPLQVGLSARVGVSECDGGAVLGGGCLPVPLLFEQFAKHVVRFERRSCFNRRGKIAPQKTNPKGIVAARAQQDACAVPQGLALFERCGFEVAQDLLHIVQPIAVGKKT